MAAVSLICRRMLLFTVPLGGEKSRQLSRSYSRPMASLIERNVVSRQRPIALTIELSLMAVVEKSPGRKDEVVASLG